MPIDYNGKLYLYSIESDRFNLSKTTKDWKCLICKSIIARGSFCLGSGCHKTCLKCSESLLNNFVESMEENKKKIIQLKTNLKKYKTEHLKNNMVCAL